MKIECEGDYAGGDDGGDKSKLKPSAAGEFRLRGFLGGFSAPIAACSSSVQ